MNYQVIYDRLMDRAKVRVITGYTERHHIIPRCLGGDDSSENLVSLTPEEHYVAHQLLVKVHPTNHGLKYAVVKMTSGKYRNNKLYAWIRKAYSESKRGRKNSPEHVAKVAAAHRGLRRSDETRARIASSKVGKSRPESVKRAVSTANKNRAAALTPEERSRRASELAKKRWSKK